MNIWEKLSVPPLSAPDMLFFVNEVVVTAHSPSNKWTRVLDIPSAAHKPLS